MGQTRVGRTRAKRPPPGSGGAAGVETARGTQVSHGRGPPAEPVEQEAQVVVAVREVGVGGQRPLVALDRGGGAAGVLQQAPQVEVRDGVVRRVADGRLVVRLRRSALAGGVEEAPEVDVRVGQRRIEGQGLLVGVTRLGRRGGLALAAQIEPLLGGPRGRQLLGH